MARYFSARWKDAQAAAEAAEVAAPAAAAASAVARAASRVIRVIRGSERTLDLDLEVRLTLPAKKGDLTEPLILLPQFLFLFSPRVIYGELKPDVSRCSRERLDVLPIWNMFASEERYDAPHDLRGG